MKLFFILSFLFISLSFSTKAKEIWILDTDLSTIKFELPVLLANNVLGEFKIIDGLVEIDLETKKNNKAIFSVDIESIDMNYKKYKKFLMGDIFFHTTKYPKALVDTKKFTYQNQDTLNLDVELTIKNITNTVPLSLKIIKLTEELVQIKGNVNFLRTAFQVGIGKWKNTSILRDEISLTVNLFLFKE